MLRIALFADVHGKLLLPFKLVRYYQNLTGNKIDFILQCGDMGIFPHKDRLDKATLRHAKNDRDELGFMDEFVQVKPKVQHLLDELNIPLIGVRGNHEDHQFLDKLEKETSTPYFSVDVYQKIFVCQTAKPFILDNGIDNLSVVGIGRIGDEKGRTSDKFIQDYERKNIDTLIKDSKNKSIEFDILITHDKSTSNQRGFGLPDIEKLLDNIPFHYHFYGHTGEPFNQTLADNGITQSVKIQELEFNTKGTLSAGCMLILEKSGNDIRLTDIPLHQIIHFDKKIWRNL